MSKWHYFGDINIKHGGYFWREDGADDYVLCVRLTPCSDAGLPDNQYWLECGPVYLGCSDTLRASLECVGQNMASVQELPENQQRAIIVDAVLSYAGLDGSDQHVMQVGPIDPDHSGEMPLTPDIRLPADADIDAYIQSNWLT